MPLQAAVSGVNCWLEHTLINYIGLKITARVRRDFLNQYLLQIIGKLKGTGCPVNKLSPRRKK